MLLSLRWSMCLDLDNAKQHLQILFPLQDPAVQRHMPKSHQARLLKCQLYQLLAVQRTVFQGLLVCRRIAALLVSEATGLWAAPAAGPQ